MISYRVESKPSLGNRELTDYWPEFTEGEFRFRLGREFGTEAAAREQGDKFVEAVNQPGKQLKLALDALQMATMALNQARDTIYGLHRDAAWAEYQHSPQMLQITAAIESGAHVLIAASEKS